MPLQFSALEGFFELFKTAKNQLICQGKAKLSSRTGLELCQSSSQYHSRKNEDTISNATLYHRTPSSGAVSSTTSATSGTHGGGISKEGRFGSGRFQRKSLRRSSGGRGGGSTSRNTNKSPTEIARLKKQVNIAIGFHLAVQ